MKKLYTCSQGDILKYAGEYLEKEGYRKHREGPRGSAYRKKPGINLLLLILLLAGGYYTRGITTLLGVLYLLHYKKKRPRQVLVLIDRVPEGTVVKTRKDVIDEIDKGTLYQHKKRGG